MELKPFMSMQMECYSMRKKGDIELHYFYDTNGTLTGIQTIGANGAATTYYVVTNTRGDVTQIYDETGTLQVLYTYDAWGKVLSIKDGNGSEITSGTNIGILNSLRYRSYYYDSETGLYYLQSRYYNPEWNRFINADSELGYPGELFSHNVFAYCQNNPINNYDPDGHELVGALVGGGFGVLLGKAVAKYYGLTGWKKAATIVGFTVGGAAIGWFAGVIVAKLAKTILASITGVVATAAPIIGSKLDYMFGKATGSIHNIQRSVDMLRQLNRIGIFDNNSGRNYVMNAFIQAFKDPNTIAKIQENGRTVREFLLMGPNGGVKVQSIWEGAKLITFELFGGR
jgi:RHS repeat-associated protein